MQPCKRVKDILQKNLDLCWGEAGRICGSVVVLDCAAVAVVVTVAASDIKVFVFVIAVVSRFAGVFEDSGQGERIRLLYKVQTLWQSDREEGTRER